MTNGIYAPLIAIFIAIKDRTMCAWYYLEKQRVLIHNRCFLYFSKMSLFCLPILLTEQLPVRTIYPCVFPSFAEFSVYTASLDKMSGLLLWNIHRLLVVYSVALVWNAQTREVFVAQWPARGNVLLSGRMCYILFKNYTCASYSIEGRMSCMRRLNYWNTCVELISFFIS